MGQPLLSVNRNPKRCSCRVYERKFNLVRNLFNHYTNHASFNGVNLWIPMGLSGDLSHMGRAVKLL